MHRRRARCGQRRKTHTDPRTKAKLVPACFLVSRFFPATLLSGSGGGAAAAAAAAKMMTDVHAHLSDGRETTVTTTVIHDHVDLRSATHYLVCLACACLCTNDSASERANVRESFLDRSIKFTRGSQRIGILKI